MDEKTRKAAEDFFAGRSDLIPSVFGVDGIFGEETKALVAAQTEIDRAIATLLKSERGKCALADTLAMLDDGGISLDQYGQAAVLTLLRAAFDRPSVRDAIREALED